MTDRILTTGRLDGLVITPIAKDGAVTALVFTARDLPGLRLILEADAARELTTAIDIVLGEVPA